MSFIRSSISRKLGALYVLLFGLIAGLGAIVTVQNRSMSNDAEILLEETRELVIARDLFERLDHLAALSELPTDSALTGAQRTRLLDELRAIVDVLHEVSHGDADPSRPSHQEREDQLLEGIERDLERYMDRLGNNAAPSEENLRQLQEARDYVASLITETRTEYELAGEDLAHKSSRTVRVVGLAVVAAILLLCASSFLVMRGVVRPISRLRQSAERFGRGELDHRIRIENRDELGSLAASFNEMADRVSSTHADLEAQVTARTREFIRAARLADLGMLAAGVAHEINNPLASISACAEGLQRRLDSGRLEQDDLGEYLGIVRTEAGRAKTITSRLLELARQEPDMLSEFELGLALDHVAKAAKYVLDRRNVRLVVDVREPETLIFGNAGELTQICMNLLSNAKHASESGSTVTLECGRRGDEVRIRVTDQGHGIDPENVERIFEPFFTTKESGRGTGLGLALTLAMVESRGGRIAIESEPGAGTTVIVDLPLRWSAA